MKISYSKNRPARFFSSMSNLLGSILMILALGVTGCSDNDPTVGSSGEFALLTTDISADGQTRAFYLQRASVTNTETIDNSNATELDPATQAMVHSYNGEVYFSDYANGRMGKWSMDANGLATNEGNMTISELGFQGNTAFLNENTAFVGGLSTSIIIFDPTTMKKTGTIDFSAFSKVGDVTDFPQTGASIAAEAVTEILVRDNLLFAALMPLSDLATFAPGISGCTIVVVDIDKVDVNAQGNTGAVINRIYDERGSATGAWGSGGGNSFMQLDENDNIYMICHNTWGGWRQVFNKPACVLKIENGEMDFDKGYYFDLESAAAGIGNPVINLEYYGGGKFLAAVQDPEALDPGNSFSYFTDPVWQWWNFDLINKTANIVTYEGTTSTDASETYTRGALTAVTYIEDDIAYVPFTNNVENYIMRVDLNTLKASKQFSTNSIPRLYSLQ